jgi:REP element-mobilizing transposase RayT
MRMPSRKRGSRPRKRHVQEPLRLRFDRNGQRRGGKRAGAGRKAKDPTRPSQRHLRRPDVDPTKPLHVTLRVVEAVGYLRKPRLFAAIRVALLVAARREDFRIVHFSIQGNHLHLIVEAASREALWKGMKGFQVSAARRINAELSRRTGERRTGTVFADRYHVLPITSVTHVRNAIRYVLCNWRHHNTRGERLEGLFDGKLDPYSSAVFFPGWRERTVPLYIPSGYEPPKVCSPETWLLREGWKRARPISVWEAP